MNRKPRFIRRSNDCKPPKSTTQNHLCFLLIRRLPRYGFAKFMITTMNGCRPRDFLPPHLRQVPGELWLTYIDRLSNWETRVRDFWPSLFVTVFLC